MAIPDHPWTKATKDGAAVRIAMTVAERGDHEGELREVTKDIALNTDEPKIELARTRARINADLTAGANITATAPLNANDGLSCNGMMLAGQGFKISKATAEELCREDGDGARSIVRPHIGGSELVQRWLDEYVIDLTGVSETDARQLYPAAYQYILRTVKPDRDVSRDASFREKWWLFGRTRPEIRTANEQISRYIATTRTSKHRVFQFVPAGTIPNHEIVVISVDDAFLLGVLSSRIHIDWAISAGGTLEDRPRYNKRKCFDHFPFPDATPEQRARIAELAEELDATRKAALAETDRLTMTELYNLREKLRQSSSGAGAPMDEKEQRRATKARAAIVNRLHEQLDQAVADAYGWGEEWRAGTLGPSEIVARLVALNHERAAEEKAGKIRWLRPDYQEPRFGKK
jgi:hypothetical protein